MKLLLTVLACVASARALAPVRATRTRLAAAAVASDLSVSEAGHLLGFGDATHEPTTLQQIMARCIATAEALPATAIADLKEKAAALDEELGPPLDAAARLAADASAPGTVAVAAEFKRASPSKGPINVDADVREVAKLYASAGASLVSVLTEPDAFQGSLKDLSDARRAVNASPTRPALLRKDFVARRVQVWEARASGADAVLLIVACLTRTELRDLVEECAEAGILALVEVHTEAEMALALETPGVACIGINNRNLHSFKLDMGTTARLTQGHTRVLQCHFNSSV